MAKALHSKAEIKIRLREPLRAKIERAAKRRGVSMNSEMIHRLDQSFFGDWHRAATRDFIKYLRPRTIIGRIPKLAKRKNRRVRK